MKIRGLFLALLLVFASKVSYAQQLHTVAVVDLNRYLGKWYEIARLPNRFQADCIADVTAEYTKRADGQIDVLNRCKKADGTMDQALGRARVADAAGNAKLKVRFAPDWLAWIPQVWGDYWIIELASDYSYAVVGVPTRNYLWILSRTPEMPDASYEAIVNRITAQGFDTSALLKTSQKIGK